MYSYDELEPVGLIVTSSIKKPWGLLLSIIYLEILVSWAVVHLITALSSSGLTVKLNMKAPANAVDIKAKVRNNFKKVF